MKNYDLLATPFKIIKEDKQESPSDKYPFPHEQIIKHRPFENIADGVSNLLKKMIDDARSGREAGNLKDLDMEFLMNDTMNRIQTAVDYANTALQVLVKKDGTDRE